MHDFGKILSDSISSIATTSDNKYLFVCAENGSFKEFDITIHNQTSPWRSYDQVNNFKVENAWKCVITYDNKFLITAPCGLIVKLTKHSMQTKEKLHTWDKTVHGFICS